MLFTVIQSLGFFTHKQVSINLASHKCHFLAVFNSCQSLKHTFIYVYVPIGIGTVKHRIRESVGSSKIMTEIQSEKRV